MSDFKKNIHKDVGWYVSYMQEKQGIAMVKALQLKIKQYEYLLATIKSEADLVHWPDEKDPYMVLKSIESLIDNLPEISAKESSFEWVG